MKTVSYSTLADPDAIATSLATAVTDTDYEDTDLDGATGTALMVPARTVTVSTAANTGSYILGSKIIVAGRDRDGLAVTEEFTVADEDGGEDFVGTQGFRNIEMVTVEAQTDTDGAVTVGVRDVVLDPNGSLKEIRVGAASGSQMKLEYSDGSVDIITQIQRGEHFLVEPTKIYGDSDTTATDLVLFFRAR